MSRFLLSPGARSDLTEIRDYVARQGGRRVAAQVLHELRDSMLRIAGNPLIGHVRDDLTLEAVRFYRVYKYLIIYRPEADPVAIVRVLHGARDVRTILGTEE